jgi:hypothetical protein
MSISIFGVEWKGLLKTTTLYKPKNSKEQLISQLVSIFGGILFII